MKKMKDMGADAVGPRRKLMHAIVVWIITNLDTLFEAIKIYINQFIGLSFIHVIWIVNAVGVFLLWVNGGVREDDGEGGCRQGGRDGWRRWVEVKVKGRFCCSFKSLPGCCSIFIANLKFLWFDNATPSF
ncbi:hypothetical protein Hanom_Chr14g01263541 [Helianthus anomalus]